MSDVEQRRCWNCDALVSADADWCGQCFSSLKEAEPAPEPAAVTPGGEPKSQPKGDPFWPCSVCEGSNPLAADACVTCGTPFAHVMRAQADTGTRVDTTDALVWSLVFPGLGHRRLGRAMDGLARGVLFAVSAGMAVMMAFGGLRKAVTLAVFAAFALAALAVYGMSAYETGRLARGEGLLVSSRNLMWVLVGVMLLSVGALTLAFVTATEG